jgi:hypothetical protein
MATPVFCLSLREGAGQNPAYWPAHRQRRGAWGRAARSDAVDMPETGDALGRAPDARDDDVTLGNQIAVITPRHETDERRRYRTNPAANSRLD